MKNVIVPTDFSDNAATALQYAFDFLADREATVHILHVVNTTLIVSDAPEVAADMIKSEVNRVTETMAVLEELSRISSPENITIKTAVLTGPISPTIKRHALEVNADCIIAGSRGKDHNRIDKWLGTISTNIIRDAPCPTILVPTGFVFTELYDVVFGTCLETGDFYEMERSSHYLKPHDPKIHALHIAQDVDAKPDRKLSEFMRMFNEKSMDIDIAYKAQSKRSIESEIMDYVHQLHAELIIMHKEKDNFWRSILKKSKTKAVASMIDVPLMVLD